MQIQQMSGGVAVDAFVAEHVDYAARLQALCDDDALLQPIVRLLCTLAVRLVDLS